MQQALSKAEGKWFLLLSKQTLSPDDDRGNDIVQVCRSWVAITKMTHAPHAWSCVGRDLGLHLDPATDQLCGLGKLHEISQPQCLHL